MFLVNTAFTYDNRSCVTSSLVRLAYAIEYTKVPPAATSLFRGMAKSISIRNVLIVAAPFIYNSLWACIEPPFFIMTGCLICFGPLFRSGKGPRSLFRSLRSRLMRLSAKSSSGNRAQSDPKSENKEPGWQVLHEPQQATMATFRAQWELNDVSAADEAGFPRKSAENMV